MNDFPKILIWASGLLEYQKEIWKRQILGLKVTISICESSVGSV